MTDKEIAAVNSDALLLPMTASSLALAHNVATSMENSSLLARYIPTFSEEKLLKTEKTIVERIIACTFWVHYFILVFVSDRTSKNKATIPQRNEFLL